MKRKLFFAMLCTAATALSFDSAQAQAQAPLWRVPGPIPNAWAGYSVDVIGDLNADGMAEYLVGAPHDWFVVPPPTPAATYWQGQFVVYNGANGTQYFPEYLGAYGDQLGAAVAGLDDLNGDGIPEFCAGAVQGYLIPPLPLPPSFRGQGYVNVYDGATGTLLRRISGISNFPPPFPNGAAFGRTVANLGDVDGDGIGDLGVGAPFDMWGGSSSQGSGQVWVFSGATIASAPPGNILPITNIVSPFFATSMEEAFGLSLDGISDLDGDGLNEILIGAPISNGQDGAAYVYTALGGTLWMVDTGLPGMAEQHGSCVSRAGDVDLDGSEDFLVGAPEAGTFPGSGDGRVRVISGQTGQALFTFMGDDIYSHPNMAVSGIGRLGYSAAGVGDLDADGYPDFALAAPQDSFQDPDTTSQSVGGVTPYNWFLPPGAWTPPYTTSARGTVRVMSGRTGNLLNTYSGTSSAAGLGASLASGGDMNGDGKWDILIGATQGQSGGPGYHEVRSGAYELGQVYGYSNPNSTGANATLRASGSVSLAENALKFTVQGLPANSSGMFFFGPNMLSTPIQLSNGLNWIGNPNYRAGNVVVPPTGTLVYTMNLSQAPFVGLISPGTEFAFQFYYRNSILGPGVSNLSDAVNLGFMP